MAELSEKELTGIEKSQRLYAQQLVDIRTISTLVYQEDSLLIFVDESGDNVRSAENPHLCIGGVAVCGKDYALLMSDWSKIKREIIGLRPNERFHATKHLRKRTKFGDYKLEYFLATARIHAVLGWDPLISIFDRSEFRRDISVLNCLSVVQDHVDQISEYQHKHEHWIMERSGKHEWRALRRWTITGNYLFSFPRSPNAQLSFIEKTKTAEAGLEIADLLIYLFGHLNPYTRNIVEKYRASQTNSPPYRLRLFQAAIGNPFPPLCSPPWRKPQLGLDLLSWY